MSVSAILAGLFPDQFGRTVTTSRTKQPRTPGAFNCLEGKRFELLSGNNLPDPEVGIFYLPFGENITGDYTEYQITQSFEFPTVYSSRKNLINQQVSQYELEYKARRQEILGSAQAYALELILISKKNWTSLHPEPNKPKQFLIR